MIFSVTKQFRPPHAGLPAGDFAEDVYQDAGIDLHCELYELRDLVKRARWFEPEVGALLDFLDAKFGETCGGYETSNDIIVWVLFRAGPQRAKPIKLDMWERQP